MEQFNDTPIVNGVAYPKVTVRARSPTGCGCSTPPTTGSSTSSGTPPTPTQGDGTTEVKLNAAELAAAQTDPNVSPTPADANNNAAGPDWVQFANEGGFLPAPTVIDGQQPTTWITDPTRFDVGNVDQHSMLLAPAERADAVVDFSKFAGKTLILYNDAPAAFPARVPGYDYYTGAPDLSPTGAPTILPGYGPNTRTVMQVTVADTTPSAAVRRGQAQERLHPQGQRLGRVRVEPAPADRRPGGVQLGDGQQLRRHRRVQGARRHEVRRPGPRQRHGQLHLQHHSSPRATKTTMKMEPKAIHDETNSTTFDEFGRMQANLGIEAQPPTPGLQNVTLYPFVNPQTELIDGTNLPKQVVTTDSVTGEPVRTSRSPRSATPRTARRSGGSPTTASTPTRSTSTCTTSRCSTGSRGTTSSSRTTRTRTAGRTPCG